MDQTAALLTERGKTHGRFEDHARATWHLMRVIQLEQVHRVDRGQGPLTMEQAEALHMICHKIGRILAGDANYTDHWDDIAGYAKLCSKALEDFGYTITADSPHERNRPKEPSQDRRNTERRVGKVWPFMMKQPQRRVGLDRRKPPVA